MDIIEEARNNEMINKVLDHGSRIAALEKTSELIVEIHTVLMGTYKEPGILRAIDNHDKFIEACKARHAEDKKERIDWVKWAERLTIAAMFTWILTKLGLK
jgi:hypothetical protein